MKISIFSNPGIRSIINEFFKKKQVLYLGYMSFILWMVQRDMFSFTPKKSISFALKGEF